MLDRLLEYKRNWIQHVNRIPRNRLPMIMKLYSPTGRRIYGRPLKRLLDTWDQNGSTSGPTPWQIYDDDLVLTPYFKAYLQRPKFPQLINWSSTFYGNPSSITLFKRIYYLSFSRSDWNHSTQTTPISFRHIL
jgi:hypothetical protein